jgi:hypothetical protein
MKEMRAGESILFSDYQIFIGCTNVFFLEI